MHGVTPSRCASLPATPRAPRRPILALLASLAIGFAGCTARPVATPVALGGGVWQLPAANWVRDDGSRLACAGTGWIGAIIEGSPDDPFVVWIERAGSRIRLAWPWGGYRARFTPALEILDPNGVVILREGDAVRGGCLTADPGVWQVDPG